MANLAGSWHDAAFQMQTTADLAPFLQNPSYHIILSFSDTEHPSDREIFDAGHRAVAELGADEHQYLMAIHKNRINIHLHIICNRVHPISGRVLPSGHDYARLELACRKIENSNGWPQDRGRFDCMIQGDEVMLVPKPDAHWQQKTHDRGMGHRPDGLAVRRQEQRNGLPPLRDFLSTQSLERIGSAIAGSNSWQDVHTALRAEFLLYERYRTGARISRSEGSFFMPAGQLGTSCTLKNLEARLGPFEAVKDVQAPAEAMPIVEPERSLEAKGPLPFEAAVLFVKGMIKDVKLWRRDRGEARTKQRAKQREEKRQVRDLLAGSRSVAAQALRRVMRDVHQEQAAELRLQHPRPHPSPVDAISHIGRLAPDELQRRRYRHVHRAREMPDNRAHEETPRDHTAYRQIWCLAKETDSFLIAQQAAKLVLRHTDAIRVNERGSLLFARRNAGGSIVGFDICYEDKLDAEIFRPTGSGEGLCVIGSRAAPICVIVPDVATGLIQASVRNERDALIIVAAQPMTIREQHQLLELKQVGMKTHEVQSILVTMWETTKDPGHAGPKDMGALSDGEAPANDPELDDLSFYGGPAPS